MCSVDVCSIPTNACLVNKMLLSFLVQGEVSFLPGKVYSTLVEGAVVDLPSFCEVLFESGWFDADVICIALVYTRSVVKKNNIANPLFLAKLFQTAIALASKYHDDFSAYDKTYRQLIPQHPVSPTEFMSLQFFFLEQLHYDMMVSSQQIAAVRGIFGSITTGANWVSEVMHVLKAKGSEVTILDLVVIVEMSVWWKDLHPACCRDPIYVFFAAFLRRFASSMSVPLSIFSLIIEYCCTGATGALGVIEPCLNVVL